MGGPPSFGAPIGPNGKPVPQEAPKPKGGVLGALSSGFNALAAALPFGSSSPTSPPPSTPKPIGAFGGQLSPPSIAVPGTGSTGGGVGMSPAGGITGSTSGVFNAVPPPGG